MRMTKEFQDLLNACYDDGIDWTAEPTGAMCIPLDPDARDWMRDEHAPLIWAWEDWDEEAPAPHRYELRITWDDGSAESELITARLKTPITWEFACQYPAVAAFVINLGARLLRERYKGFVPPQS